MAFSFTENQLTHQERGRNTEMAFIDTAGKINSIKQVWPKKKPNKQKNAPNKQEIGFVLIGWYVPNLFLFKSRKNKNAF